MLNYIKSGAGKNTMVLVHGFLESVEIWKEMLPELEEKFTLIRVNLPGHGNQPIVAEVQTMELMAKLLKETLDEIGVSHFHLVGHSMGGYVSLAYAEIFGEDLKSLTLFFSTYFPDSEEKKETRSKSFRIIKEEFRKYVYAGVSSLFGPNDREKLQPQIDFAKNIALETSPEGALASVKGMMERPDRKNVLENLNCKILFITGKHDTAADAKQIIENLPKRENIRAYMLDCGHQGQLEKPKICTEIICEELI